MSFAQRLQRLGADLDLEVKHAVELATESAECEKRLLEEEARVLRGLWLVSSCSDRPSVVEIAMFWTVEGG